MMPVGLGHDEVASISFAQSVPGVPHLKEGDARPQGGRPRWAAPPNPWMGPWLILLKKIAQSHNLFLSLRVGLETRLQLLCDLSNDIVMIQYLPGFHDPHNCSFNLGFRSSSTLCLVSCFQA
nr:D-aminoacyl-tRNA deacylase [Ipomoea batatas]